MRNIDQQTDDILQSDSQVKKNLLDTKNWFREKINQVLFPTNRIVGIRERPNTFYNENLDRRIFRGSQIKPAHYTVGIIIQNTKELYLITMHFQ